MKRKQLCSIITAALMVSTLVMPCNVNGVDAKEETSVSASSIDLSKVDLKAENVSNNTQNLMAKIYITNNTGADLDLSQVPIKYYYTNETGATQEFHCDYSGTVNSPNYQGFTDKIQGSIRSLSEDEKAPGKDTEVTIKFTSGTIQPGDKVEINLRINGTNWANYDYSNDAGLGELVQEPTIAQKEISFYEGTAADTNVAIDYKGSKTTLTSISEGNKVLTSNEYTTDSVGNVILKGSYLNSLTADTTLTYTFSDGYTITQTIKVNKVQPTVSATDTKFNPEAPADINTTVDYKNGKNITLTKITNGSKTLDSTKDYTVSGNEVKISQSYLASQKSNEDKNITLTYWFSNGTKANVTLTILGNHVSLDISLGSIEKCNPGDEIEVPVILNNVPKYALLDYEFGVSYDASKLEFEGVKAAGLTEGFDDSFELKDNVAGTVRIQYLISDDDAQDINEAGTLCILKFKVKDTEDCKTEVSIKDGSSKFNYFDDEAGEGYKFEVTTHSASIGIKTVKPFIVDVDDEVEGKQGEEVVVPVRLNEFNTTQAVLDFEFVMKYDASKLEFEGVEGAGLTEGFDDSFELKDNVAGSARIQYLISDDEAQDITSGGVLLNLKFKVKDEAEGIASISLSNDKFNYFNDEEGVGGVFKPGLEAGSVKAIPTPGKKLIIDADDEVEGKQGEEVVVPVRLSDLAASNKLLLDYEITMAYDASALEFEGVEGAGLTEGFDDSFVLKDNVSGSVRIQYLISDDDAQDMKDDGVLFNLKFKVKKDAKAGLTSIKLSNAKFNNFNDEEGVGGLFKTELVDGSVNVKEADKEIIKIDADDEVAGKQGEEVVVPVRLSDLASLNKVLLDYEITMTYDASVLEFEGVEGAGLTEGFDDSFELKDNVSGSVRIQYLISDDDAQDIKADGVLFNLKFKVNKDAKEGLTSIKLSNAKFNNFDDEQGVGGLFDTQLVDGSVKVEKADEPVKPDEPIEEKVKLDVADKVDVKAGEEVEVPVTLSGLYGTNPLLDYEVTMTYDASKLEFEGVVGAGLTEGFDDSFVLKDNVSGSARIQYLISDDDAQDINNDGVLFNLKFKAKEGTEGLADVNLTAAKLNYFDDEQGVGGLFNTNLEGGSVNIAKVEEEKKDYNPTVVLSDTEFDKASEKDLVATVNTDGAEFKGVKEVSGVSLSDGKVTIEKSYFAGKDNGDYDLTFQFVKDGVEKEVKVTVKVKGQKDYNPTVVLSDTEFDKAAEKDIVATVNTDGAEFKGVKEVSGVSLSDGKVTIEKSYFAGKDNGNYNLTFQFVKDGVAKEVTVTVTVKGEAQTPTENKLSLSTPDVTAEAGSTVSIPIYLHIDEDQYVYGIQMNYKLGTGLSYSKFTKGADMTSIKADVSCNKTGFAYAVFPAASSGVHVTGDLLFGTINVKVAEGLASGTEIPVTFTNVQYSDASFKPVDSAVTAGKVIVK